jgi:hypothetical protein
MPCVPQLNPTTAQNASRPVNQLEIVAAIPVEPSAVRPTNSRGKGAHKAGRKGLTTVLWNVDDSYRAANTTAVKTATRVHVLRVWKQASKMSPVIVDVLVWMLLSAVALNSPIVPILVNGLIPVVMYVFFITTAILMTNLARLVLSSSLVNVCAVKRISRTFHAIVNRRIVV